MGKRSRKRGVEPGAQRPVAPRQSAAPRGARASDLRTPESTFVGRMRESWTIAGQKPAGELTREERKARHKQRIERREAERPAGLFGPYPISEILMLIGLIGLVITFAAGVEENEPTLIASVAVIAIGTFELTAREHFRGFRAHSFFLAIIVTVAVHVAAAVIGPDGTGSEPVLLAVDIVVFGVAYWQFAVQYSRARRRREAAPR